MPHIHCIRVYTSYRYIHSLGVQATLYTSVRRCTFYARASVMEPRADIREERHAQPPQAQAYMWPPPMGTPPRELYSPGPWGMGGHGATSCTCMVPQGGCGSQQLSTPTAYAPGVCIGSSTTYYNSIWIGRACAYVCPAARARGAACRHGADAARGRGSAELPTRV